MTETDELRAMLDERGVKWTGTRQGATFWCGEHGLHWMAYEASEGKIDLCTSMINATPVEIIEATLGRCDYTYEQWREISDAVGDAMEYAHDRAIECPDKADPLWNLDEYVNRVLKVAFGSEATQGRGECHIKDYEDTGYCVCSECGAVLPDDYTVYYCWSCGRKVVDE